MQPVNKLLPSPLGTHSCTFFAASVKHILHLPLFSVDQHCARAKTPSPPSTANPRSAASSVTFDTVAVTRLAVSFPTVGLTQMPMS
ncbi:hypothetical protein VIGAN_01402900 [Vigna angularis var. angularis]|uniref:Uncharacterized protein n=1 Tax=Vigna angularis var. angularis TaxID=157739 RepID=A0A0S3R694_PHAAN|nr:hypothetical protein VIGAN_01402900 [Vigna angularis var. angularis]